jgi:hypothetical protein
MVTRPCPNTMSNDILIQKIGYVFLSYLLHLRTTLPIAWSGKRWSNTVICKNIDANVEAFLILVYSFLFYLLNAISEEQWNLNQINWKRKCVVLCRYNKSSNLHWTRDDGHETFEKLNLKHELLLCMQQQAPAWTKL